MYVFFIRFRGLTPDLKVYEKHMADLNVKLDVYDKILSKQKYIAGDVGIFSSLINTLNFNFRSRNSHSPIFTTPLEDSCSSMSEVTSWNRSLTLPGKDLCSKAIVLSI